MHTEKYLPNHQIGLKWKNDQGDDCETILKSHMIRNGKRIAKLVESDFIGSIGAMHYYASVRVYHPSWSENGDDGGHGGYGGKLRPEMNDIRIDAERKLTKPEKDMNGEQICKVGEMTIRFNTPKDARMAAIKCFKKHFAPGWILLLDSMCDDDQSDIVAET